jgi:hypothetical protein
MNFQPILPIKLTDKWKVIVRPSVPIFFSEATPKRRGGFDRRTGLGNIGLPLVLTPDRSLKVGNGQLVGGVGPTFKFPTGSDSTLSTRTWEMGPSAIVVWKNEKITAGIFPQYFWDYANRSGDQPTTSHGELLYFFNYNLAGAWQIGFSPTITHNHMADSDDQWNVPIGLLIAKTTMIGKRPVKIQFGIEYSVISEESYGKQVLFKLNIIPVVQALIKDPIFGGG